MRTSTIIRAFLLLFILGWALPAFAQRPVVAVAPFGHDVPNIRTGLADQLWRQLLGSGRYEMADDERVAGLLKELDYDAADARPTTEQIMGLAGEADYLLVADVTAFDIVERDAVLQFGWELRDLATMFGGQDRVAYVAFDVRLYSTADGGELTRYTVEGMENKRGVRLKNLTLGWLGSADLDSDEFRRTNLGIATYKAIGEIMRLLYEQFPLEGSVLAISGDALVLNLDERSGLLLGDELTVIRRSAITNDAGEQVWESAERIGSCKVVEFQPGRCLCQVLDGLGVIQEGDVVVPLYENITLPQETDRVK